MADDFVAQYLAYTSDTEVPTFFHRWSCLSGIGAVLGRNYYFQHGYASLHPNLYAMLIGSPGTRKNTAVNIMRNLIVQAGYSTIAADKTTKEKFLMDLAGIETDESINGGKYAKTKYTADQILEANLWGEEDATTKPPAEIFIVAPEFNDFLGNGNIEFISLLGNLWDYKGVYRSRIKNGKSIAVNDPTISILGGNTPTGFSLAFPTEIFGQGFFSRLLLIYGEPSGRKITFPKAPSDADTAAIVSAINTIRKHSVGLAGLTSGAESLLDKIYKTWGGIDDTRFESYANRRFTHLLKLCLVIAATQYSKEINERIVITANTVLSYTEHLMPKALGEFGKAKNSDIVHKVLTILQSTTKPLGWKDIWEDVSQDLDAPKQLLDIMQNLLVAQKIFFVAEASGYLAKKKIVVMDSNDTLDWDILTTEEKNMR